MRFELKRVSPWAFIKVAFFVNLVVGFVFGLFQAAYMQFVFLILGDIPAFDSLGTELQGLSTAFFWIIFPILSAVFGAVIITLLELIIVAVYNVVARLLGGMEFDLSESVVMQPTGVPPTMYAQSPPPPAPVASTTPPSPPATASTPPAPPSESLRPDTPPPPTNHPSWRPIHHVDEQSDSSEKPKDPPEQV